MVCFRVCRLCLYSVYHASVPVCPLHTWPLSLVCCISSSQLMRSTCLSLAPLMSVMSCPSVWPPLLPVRIVGKPSLLSTRWLKVGPCGYFPVGDGAMHLPFGVCVFLSGLFFLFLMFKWPLVVICCYCTLYLDSYQLIPHCFPGSTNNKETITHSHPPHSRRLLNCITLYREVLLFYRLY